MVDVTYSVRQFRDVDSSEVITVEKTLTFTDEQAAVILSELINGEFIRTGSGAALRRKLEERAESVETVEYKDDESERVTWELNDE